MAGGSSLCARVLLATWLMLGPLAPLLLLPLLGGGPLGAEAAAGQPGMEVSQAPHAAEIIFARQDVPGCVSWGEWLGREIGKPNLTEGDGGVLSGGGGGGAKKNGGSERWSGGRGVGTVAGVLAVALWVSGSLGGGG